MIRTKHVGATVVLAGLALIACGQDVSPTCTAPKGTLQVTVTANECAACGQIAIIAQSPQITAAIRAGHSPCAQEVSDGPVGCVMGTVFVASFGDCGGSACGPYTVDLSNEFPPTGVSITDTIAFCPYDKPGFAPIGNCASSFSNQCSGTLNVFIDGIAPPATGSDGGNSNDGGNNGSNDAGSDSGNDAGGNDAGNTCLADNTACTRGGVSTCCSQYCSCSNLCTTRPANPVICP
jgi:hypothetical protein